ncbi:MAG: UDP-glucose 6-dehydrogenase [Acidobacteria bacterium]|nr:MAG: UDP-glucose 6-dehydrogenase [Acidobacteriota bacterium]
MHITVMGTGYVGLVVGAGLADFGLMVTCVDINQEKIGLLKEGKVPIFEPGLEEIVRRNVERGRLCFSTDIKQAIRNCLVIFVAVGTDAGPDGVADLSQIWSAADQIAQSMEDYKIVVIKSSVPVGTTAGLEARMQQSLSGRNGHLDFDLISNPEFLREGSAIEDFFHPDRIIVGSRSERAAAIIKDIYRPLYLIETPFMFTTWESAELAKYAANAFLALKVSFVNELANLCDAVGANADVHVVARCLGLDRRIGGKFLHPGPGFGGYCFPKDTRALAQAARKVGEQFQTVEAAIEVNDRQFGRVVDKIEKGLGSLEDKAVAVLGLSFKPNTDDVRESRSLKICEALLAAKCKLRVFDPVAMAQARRVLNDAVTYCSDCYEAVTDCDAAVIATEWNEFRNLDLERVKQSMRGDLLVDAKNIFDPARAKCAGFRYYGTGRR